ncbi:MAG: hypothetical protein Faunusvirus46_2 [Faunusvirus sp.]|jgi:hypothetical protein|uniref:Uncharacterized protein n=1 Tax=Faunusvirus sp. TaxID=2487766 RepID=A0A3G5A0H1_9VIRU|nr:MAG: hypothetical protein Faunusvirus46_2 [Faunusvirus sp.]
MDKIVHININNGSVMGLYDNLTLSFINILETTTIHLATIVNMLNKHFMSQIHQMVSVDSVKSMNNMRVNSMLINSNIMVHEYIFSFDYFAFIDVNTNQIAHVSNNDIYSYSFINKRTALNELYQNLTNMINRSYTTAVDDNLQLFIPNDIIGASISAEQNKVQSRSVGIDNSLKFINTEFVNLNKIDKTKQDIKLSPQLSPATIVKKIEDLKKIQAQELIKTKNIESVICKQERQLVKKKIKNDTKKRKLKHEQEKWEEFIRIFEADKKVYSILKTQLADKDIVESEIPIMFMAKYPLFKQLDEENILNTKNGFDRYVKQLPEIKKLSNSLLSPSEYGQLFDGDDISRNSSDKSADGSNESSDDISESEDNQLNEDADKTATDAESDNSELSYDSSDNIVENGTDDDMTIK